MLAMFCSCGKWMLLQERELLFRTWMIGTCATLLSRFSRMQRKKQNIPEEFCKEFGRVGIPVYNDLIGIIGERDKNCLPFVNMCLRTWKDRLSVDPDVWVLNAQQSRLGLARLRLRCSELIGSYYTVNRNGGKGAYMRQFFLHARRAIICKA